MFGVAGALQALYDAQRRQQSWSQFCGLGQQLANHRQQAAGEFPAKRTNHTFKEELQETIDTWLWDVKI